MELSAAVSVLSALAQPTRMMTFKLLVRAGAKGMTAGDIAAGVGATKTTMSAHLAILTRAGLITVERVGRTIVHRARIEVVEEATSFVGKPAIDTEEGGSGRSAFPTVPTALGDH